MVSSKKTEQKGGSVLTDLGALSVPFGLIAARNTLESFINNREKELKKFEDRKTKPTKPTQPTQPTKSATANTTATTKAKPGKK